jgi:hypothetical protein
MNQKNEEPIVAVVIYAKSQINTFIKSSALENLARFHPIKIYTISDDISQMCQELQITSEKLPDLNTLVRKYSGFVQLIALWKFRDRSMNHLVRAMASFGSKKQRVIWNCVVVSEMNINLLKRCIIRTFSVSILFKFVLAIEKILRNVFIYPKYRRFFTQHKSILIPFSGHVAMEFGALVWTAKKFNLNSIAIQENWDNLSTKTFILEEPDFFGVWGEQSSGHVRSIHRMLNTQVTEIGSARFNPYYVSSVADPVVSDFLGLEQTLKLPYILIGGTGDGEDDLQLINTCYESIQKLDNSDGFEIVYRPHPFTRKRIDPHEIIRKYSGILIDSGPDSTKFGHVNDLVKNCKLLVNHFSTLSLEGLISNRLVCVPLFLGRESAKYRYYHILNEWHHMMGVGLIPNLYTPRSQRDFEKILVNLLNSESPKSEFDVNWICKKTNWAEEVSRIINKAVMN